MSIHMSFSYIKHNLCKKTTRMERQHCESLDLLLRCVYIYIYIFIKNLVMFYSTEKGTSFIYTFTHTQAVNRIRCKH